MSKKSEPGGLPQKCNVLYVFDAIRSRILIPHLLERIGGYSTAEAIYEEDILEKAKRFLPNIIILDDVSLTDYLHFCRCLKADKRTKDIPVIVISANSLYVTQDKVIEAGADVYLSAPIDIDEFSAVIKAYLPR